MAKSPIHYGNQFAKGCTTSGRPRSTSLEPEEMIALGEEMVAWVKANPNILHLSEWYTIHKDYLYEEWKCFIRMKEFRPYYEKALKMVGIKYLNKDSNIKDGISQRWLRVYFPDLREEEEETKDAESARKEKENASIPPKQDDLDKDHIIITQQAEIAELKANKKSDES